VHTEAADTREIRGEREPDYRTSLAAAEAAVVVLVR